MSTIKVRPWGNVDKEKHMDLIKECRINIANTSLSNIEEVRTIHFRHPDARNFHRNFRNYLAAWDLEVEYSGAKRIEGGSKMRRLLMLFFCLCPSSNASHPPPPLSFFSQKRKSPSAKRVTQTTTPSTTPQPMTPPPTMGTTMLPTTLPCHLW